MIARAALIAALFLTSPALALPRVEVAPVRLDLNSQRPIGSLRLHNTSDAPVAFEAEAMDWMQTNGEDNLTPTQVAIITPPAFVIAPHSEQIVRVGVRAPQGDREQAFRLLFTEKFLDTGNGEQGLRMQLQMSLPVFVTPNSSPRGEPLQVEFAHEGASAKMRVSNISDRHIIIAESSVGQSKLALPRYLLAGQSVERPMPAETAPVSLAFVQGDSIVKKEYRIVPDSNRSFGQR